MPAHLSNKDPAGPSLKAFLNSSSDAGSEQADTDTPLKVDISLRTPISTPPSILLLFGSPHNQNPTDPGSASLTPITIRIDILPGGRLDVTEIKGIPDTDTSVDLNQLRGKLAGVLETCEDLGLFTEWVLKWVRRQVKK